MTTFDKFKKRIWAIIIVKSLAVGLSAAMFAVGGILLACKLADAPALYCLIGLAALPVGGGITFLLLRTDDREIARRIDETYGLNERMRTYIEYKDDDGDMARLQREDALGRLDALDIKRIRITRLPAFIVAAVAAVALFVTGAALPAVRYEPPAVAEEQQHELSDWENEALDALIKYVRESDAADGLKTKLVSALGTLKALLATGVAESSLPMYIGVTAGECERALVEENAVQGVTDTQKTINTDVVTYVVTKLYEDFGISKPVVDPGPDDPGPEDDPSGGSGGTGGVSVGGNDKFFDPVKGYVAYKDVIAEYYDTVNKAYAEGTINDAERYDAIMLYFRYLYGTRE